MKKNYVKKAFIRNLLIQNQIRIFVETKNTSMQFYPLRNSSKRKRILLTLCEDD